MNNEHPKAGTFAPPEPVSHEAFRKTPAYADLCAEFGIDPAAPWDKETVESIDAAAEFLWQYEQMRQASAAWSPENIAAYLESVVLLHEPDARALIWRERWGAVLAVTDPVGDSWLITAQPYSPNLAAVLMAKSGAASANLS